MVSRKDLLKKLVIVNGLAALVLVCLLYPVVAQSDESNTLVTSDIGTGLRAFGIAIGAGIAAGAAATGAGIGVGIAGSAALGAIAEKREMLTWSLVFVALAEGVALYGLAVAFILIGKL